MSKTIKATRPMLPTIFFMEDGDRKYIYGRYEVETIINAIYKGITEVQVGKKTIHIKAQTKTDEIWECEVEIA